jgi:hypothetical protein
MRRTAVPFLTLALVLTGRLAVPSEARAQFLRPLNDTISIGVTGGAGLGAPIDGGFELGGTIEVPISLDLRLRGDAASGRWDYGGNVATRNPPATFSRHRLLGTIIKPIVPLGPGRSLGSYFGGGAGVYLMRFSRQPDAVSAGTQVVWGVEYLTPDRRWLLSTEVQLLFVREPYRQPYEDVRGTDVGVHAGISIKRRLR